MQRIAAAYNMIPNLLWTILFVTPVVTFCYIGMRTGTVILYLVLSFVPAFFPNSFYNAIQLSRKTSFYERLGIRFINKFSQNGTIINNYIRNKYPRFKIIAGNKSSLKKLYFQTYLFEKFHFCAFIFYTIITACAGVHRYTGWVLILLTSNLFYNIYPNLLQQYIRIRLKSVIEITQPGKQKMKVD